jgi:TonB-linked SusC/RagA family outer membrane protein
MKKICYTEKHREKNKILRLQKKKLVTTLFFLIAFLTAIQLNAQTAKVIKGNVVESNGEPVIGASIGISGTTLGTITDLNGDFSITAPSTLPANAVLTVTYIGYTTQKKTIGNETVFNFVLDEDLTSLDEVVVVGYGTQRKATLTGSVVSVGNKELSSTKNQNTQNMLTGKVAGVRVVQQTSQPGELNNYFDIRGFGAPLIVIDGVSRSMDEFQRMDPGDIETISILKDASAAVYGVHSSNGVVLVTTKKGEQGKAQVEYSMYYGWQFPAEVLRPAGAFDRMTMLNEKTMRNQTEPKLTYQDEDFEKLRTGETRSYDWYDAVMRESAPQQQHNINVQGGGEKIDYFINFGYLNQEGFFKSGDLNYDRYNIRSNLNAQITKRLKVSLRLSGVLDQRERPHADVWGAFKALWRTPTTIGIYANDNPLYYNQISGVGNAVAMTSADLTGEHTYKRKIFQSSAEAAYTVPYITGLTAKAMFGYDNTLQDNSEFTKRYATYNYSGSGTYDPAYEGSINRLVRASYTDERRVWNVSLNYNRVFNAVHNVDAALVYEETYTLGYNFRGEREIKMPLPYLDLGTSVQYASGGPPSEYANKGLIGRLNYNFSGKYLFEGLFRYDGSSHFLPGEQWDFFYGLTGGWRISEESFIKDNLSLINNLKIRGSYGRLGDDGSNLYEFLGGYNYPGGGGTSGDYPRAYYLGTEFVPTIATRATPNYNITWYDIRTANIGLDFDLWNGLFGLSADLFQRDRSGLYATRAAELPGTFGAPMPQENLNSDRTKGLELELRHHHKIGELNYRLGANLALTRSMKVINIHTPYANSYDEWRNTRENRYGDVWFAWGDAGQYESYEQIGTYPVLTGTGTLPGDFIYEDWNNDGVIDDSDRYPFAITADPSKSDFQDKRNYPLMNFALNSQIAYKGFDLDFLFQGSALSNVAYGEQITQPLVWDGNVLPHLLDRWHPVDPKTDPYNPNTQWVQGYYAYGSIVADANSGFLIQNGAYLRLKSATLGYTIPKKVFGKTGINSLRLYVSGYNIFTITGVKGLDPERPTEQFGYMYPLNRTVNFGASIKF